MPIRRPRSRSALTTEESTAKGKKFRLKDMAGKWVLYMFADLTK
jgi:hypothetical protein